MIRTPDCMDMPCDYADCLSSGWMCASCKRAYCNQFKDYYEPKEDDDQ